MSDPTRRELALGTMPRGLLSGLVCMGCLLRAASQSPIGNPWEDAKAALHRRDATPTPPKGFDPFNDKTLFGMEFSLEVPEDAESKYYVSPPGVGPALAGGGDLFEALLARGRGYEGRMRRWRGE